MIRVPSHAVCAIAFALLCVPAVATAQTPSALTQPSTPPPLFNAETDLAVGATEWMATVGPAWGVVMFHSSPGHNYFQQTLSWGRVLTRPKLNGALRGRLEWAFEVTPVFAQYAPSGLYGIGFSPLDWRWNLEPRGRYAPFVELAGGVLKTSSPLPEDTLSANFMAHAGVGVRMLWRSHHSLVLQYRFDHISNGNRLDKNPGVNAHSVHVGWSWLRAGRRGATSAAP